jgi:hypothetical protein
LFPDSIEAAILRIEQENGKYQSATEWGIDLTAKKMSTKEFSRLSLSEQAKILNLSINPNAPAMTMEEIVQEVRDYRNGK